MESFKMKRIAYFRWPPGLGSCAGKNGMTMAPFHKLSAKTWPAVDTVHLQWSRHKRRLGCSATCFVTFCTDAPVSFLAMRQLSAPPTYLHLLETERMSSPCLRVRQLSTRLSPTSSGITNFQQTSDTWNFPGLDAGLRWQPGGILTDAQRGEYTGLSYSHSSVQYVS